MNNNVDVVVTSYYTCSLSLRVTSIYQTNAAAAVDMLVWCAVRAASMKSAEFLVCISTAWVKCGSVAEWLACWTQQWRIQDFCKGGAAAGAFGVPQAHSCPLSLRPLRKFHVSQLQG